MLEEVVSWREIRWIWWIKHNLIQPNSFNFWSTGCATCGHGEELGPLSWPMQLQALQFSVHLTDLVNLLLRCNGFARTQKAVVDQNGSTPPHSDHDTLLGAGLALGSALELLLGQNTELVVTSYFFVQTLWAVCCQLSYTVHFLVHLTIWLRSGSLFLHKSKRRWHFKMTIFLICSQLMRLPLIKLFHLSHLLQKPNYHRMVNTEFFSNFSCSCKRISFNDCSQLVTAIFWPLATEFSIFKDLVSFAKLLKQPLHCMLAVSGPNVLLI